MKEKVKKKKGSKIKDFWYAVKTVHEIDRLFIFQKICYTLSAVANSFAFAYTIRVAVAAIENDRPIEELTKNVIIYGSIAFVVALIRKILEPVFWYKGDRIAVTLRNKKSIRTLDMDYELLERPQTQDAVEKAGRTLGNYSGVIGMINRGFLLIQYFLSFLVACTIVVSVNGWLILIIVFLAIFKVLSENKNQKREKREFYDIVPSIWRRISYTTSISSNLTIGKDLRVYAMDDFINQERHLATDEYSQLQKKNSIKYVLHDLFIKLISILDTLFLYGFMIYEVIYHNMPIAVFTFMVSSVYTLINSLQNVIRENGNIVRVSLEVRDFRAFMEIENVREIETEEIEANRVEVEFQNVYYSYYLQEGYALEDVSFKISSKEKIALVGFNGAGKTTLVKLLSGLYHPTKGRILINGIDIETLKRDSLQKLISLVFQDSMLYAFEVAENIAMQSADDLNYEVVSDILKLIELDKKIDSLPQKVKTCITRELDETGIELSGGENQKVALARAIYKNAPLFILDEPTSAMDSLNEALMYENFNRIVQGNTAIFISHRLSSTKFCDRIFFMENSKITEVGTHDELMQLDGQYKKLFSVQANYYQGAEDEK